MEQRELLEALEKWIDAKLHSHWLRHHTGFSSAYDTTECDKAKQELLTALRHTKFPHEGVNE